MDNNKLNKKYQILKVKDNNDSYSKHYDTIFNVPLRMVLSAPSGAGKTSFAVNLLCSEIFPYHKLYDNQDVYIFAPSPYTDPKIRMIIDFYEVPDSNIFDNYSDDLLEQVYDMLVDEYQEALDDKTKPTHKLLLLDDLSFSSGFSGRFNALNKIFQNGRKYLCSCIVMSQHYKQISVATRNNANALVIWRAPNTQIEQVADEHNFLKGGKKEFMKLYYDNVVEASDFIMINYTNPSSQIYLDKNFNNITPTLDGSSS